MQYASEPIIPQTLELGGKSPNIFFADVMDTDDEFFDKALEGFALFAFNKGEVCTCPSRALVQEVDLRQFLERAVARVKKIKVGNPLDPTTMMGAQASQDQLEKILGYIDVGKKEGATCMTGGKQAHIGDEFEKGYYVEPTVFTGTQQDAHLPGRDLRSGAFRDQVQDAGGRDRDRQRYGVWPGRGRVVAQRHHRLSRGPRDQAGRVWTNCYHLYPAGAAFGGYKQSGFGRETHKIILEHYQQTKNLLVSYSPKALGFF